MNSFGSVISKYRKANHMTQDDLCKVLEKKGHQISNKGISAWESGRSNPPVEVFFELCSFFEITDIYEELYGTNPYNPASNLNESGKQRVSEYIGFLLKDERFVKEAPKEFFKSEVTSISKPEVTSMSQPEVISIFRGNKSNIIDLTKIRIYDMPVSAGTGNFLEESEYTECARDNSVPLTADYGVRISGDSMEPLFHNGQTIWVKKQSSLVPDEFGIFVVNGNAYCKQYKSNEKGTFLHSLNPAYSPIIIEESTECFVLGKVLR